MKPLMLTGGSEGELSRSEMKQIMGGSSCANGCNSLYSGYYHECNDTYPDPSSDEQKFCHDEVRDLNRACIDDCFQVT